MTTVFTHSGIDELEIDLKQVRGLINEIEEVLEGREFPLFIVAATLGAMTGDLVLSATEQVSEECGRDLYEYVTRNLRRHCRVVLESAEGVTLQ